MSRRGAAPGERRGGRGKGTPNKQTALKSALMQEKFRHLRYDPIQQVITIAKDKATPLELRVKIALELLQYNFPRLRAVEHAGAIDIDCGIAELPQAATEEDWPYAGNNGHSQHG